MNHFFLFVFLLSCGRETTETVAQTVFDNVDGYYDFSSDARFRKAIESSRNSDLKIITRNIDGSLGLGTGTYIKFRDKYYVITASHVISDSFLAITEVDSLYYYLKPFVVFTENDIAVLTTEEIPGRMAIDTTTGNIATDAMVGEKLFYTGYPNITGPLTVFGTVATVFDSQSFLLQSYAWAGASGSSVINSRGEIVAILSGIEVFTDEHGTNRGNPNIVLVQKIPKNLRQTIDYFEKRR
jgi:hypothetical protein